MAYALVGSLGTVVNSGSPSYNAPTTAGNLLICWVICSGVTPSMDQSYSTAFANTVLAIFYKENCGASETAPTVSGGPPLFSMLGEFSGGATSSALDKVGAAVTTGATSPQTNTMPSADTALGQLVVGVGKIVSTKAETVTTAMTMNNGATVTSNNLDATSTTNHYRLGYGITTGNASADAVTTTTTSMNLSAINVLGASFKLAAGGDTPTQILEKLHLLVGMANPEPPSRRGY